MSAPVSQTNHFSFLRRLLTPPAFEDDANKTRTARLLHVILPALAGVILLFATLEILVSGIGMVPVFTEAMGLVYFGLWLVLRRGHVRLVGIVTASLFLASTTMLVYFTGTIRTSITAFYIVGVVLAGLLLGNRGMHIFTGLSLLALGGLLQLEMTGRLPPATLESANIGPWLTYAGILAVIAVLLGLFTTSLNQALARAQANEESLSQSNRELQAIQATLEERVAQRTAQLGASADVGRATASILDTYQLLREVVNLITDRFGFYYAAVFLADQTGKWAVLREATGEAGRVLKERGHRLEVGGQSMVGMVMKTRRPRIALDVGEDAVRFANPLLPNTRSEIALPLMVGSRILGVLDVQSTQAAAFDETSASVLQSMADQVAVALSNTLQFQQAQTALQAARHTNEASFAVTQAEDTPGLLDALATHAVSDVDRALIVLYGSQDELGHWAYVEVAASWTRRADDPSIVVGTRYDLEQLPFVQAITSTEPFMITDVNDSSVEQGYRQILSGWKAQALLGLPLTAGNVPLGVLFLAFRRPRIFASSDLQALQAIVRQAAVVLRNQQLVSEAQAAFTRLDEVNRRLTGEAWESYTEASGGVMRKVKLARGTSPETPLTPLASTIAAPVVVNGVEIGALRLEDAAPDRAWTPTEVSLLQTAANEVAIAIEKARLIEQTEKRAQRERLVAEISSKMFAENDLESIVQIASTELGRALRFDRAAVRIGSAALSAATPQASTARGDGQQQEAQS